MRRTFVALTLIGLALAVSCSKKAAPPNTPPADPACSLSVTSLSFGTVAVGASADRQFTLTNTGGGTLSGTVSESCAEFALVGSGSYSLGTGQSKTFTMRFSPTGAGAKTCALTIGNSACTAVNCSGTGQVSNTCQISPGSLDFGSVTVGQTADRQFSITNTGGGTLTGAVSEGCPEFSIVGSASYNLSAGQSATFTVRYAPAQAGPDTCAVGTGSVECAPLACTGTAVATNADCRVSVSDLVFGQVGIGDRADATFSVTNNGSTTLSGTVTENCPDFSIAGQASYSLAPGQSQSFIVRFSPSQLGEQPCDVRVGAGCPTIDCWGSGVTGCVLQPASFDFGYVLPGEMHCRSLTLTNNTSTLQEGALIATRTAGSGFAGFIRADGVPINNVNEPLIYTLNAGQSRTFNLCWDTESTSPCDTILAAWKVWSDACRTVEVPVRGVITKGCECSVTPTSLDFGNAIVGDTSPSQTVTISNRSGVKGLSGKIRVLSGDFVTAASYGCCPDGFCAVFTTSPIRFVPTRLGPQTGKIVVENLVGCFGPGAGAVCDTVTVTGVGVTAVTSK